MRKRRRKLVAVAAVTLGASVATAMMAILLGVGDKVNRELRSFGANIEALPRQRSLPVTVGGVEYQAAAAPAYIQERELPKLKEFFWANNILAFAPFAHARVRANAPGGTTETTLLGVWFDQEFVNKDGKTYHTGVRSLNPWWKVDGNWPGEGECLIGAALAKQLNADAGQAVQVSAAGGAVSTLRVSGILSTGSDEDQQFVANLADVQRLAGLEGKVDRVEVSALTNPEDDFAHKDPELLSPKARERWTCTPYAASIAADVERALSGTEAHPVLRISQTEGALLSKIDLLMLLVTAAALGAALLGVASTMTTTVLERKAEIGLLKAIGASGASVVAIFLAEAALVGILGGLAGIGIGYGLAQAISRAVFGSPVPMSALLAPLMMAVSILVTFGGCALPLRSALRFDPAIVLRES